MTKKSLLIVYLILLTSAGMFAQTAVTLIDCYRLAEENYPFTAQKNVLQQITDESIQKINAIWQPQVYLNAQATYQSEVTSLGISLPGIEINELSKDQYKATLDVSQIIYDGGVTKQQRTIQNQLNIVETERVNIDIYKVKEKINQVYLIILQADKQIELVNNLNQELLNQEAQLKSGKQFGTASQFQLDIINVEVLKVDQRKIEIESAKAAAISMLNQLTGSTFAITSNFTTPQVNFNNTDTANERPELVLLNAQSGLSLSQMSFAEAAVLPKVSLFAQGGYGRPALNFLDDTFQFYYIGGIKLNYPLWTGNIKMHDAAIYQLNADNINLAKQTFLLNSSVQSAQQLVEINKIEQLIEKDNEIIALKSKIKAGAQAQLDNGTLSTDDFLKYVTDEHESKINKSIHEVQLLAAQLNYMTILGKL